MNGRKGSAVATDQLRIFNSMTGEKQPFTTATGHVGLYVCGITPYAITHLGHAFTYTIFDVVIRYLRHLGYRVTYVQNLTDMDDDILRESRKQGKNWRRLGEENTGEFLEDMRWLGNLQPDVFPRSTDHIQEIIALVLKLQERKHAYECKGNVYFNISTQKGYGRLSKLPRGEMLTIANERGNNPDDPNKRDPLDFVLWQAKKPGEPSWSSPWGEGRPGWHIECSVMSTRYLGGTIDIHGGGGDLIFPHHENSLVQSEGARAHPFVRYWMHTGMVRYDGEKMSKSLGNLVLMRDLKQKYHPNAVRIAILSSHYRAEWAFEEDDMERAVAVNAQLQRVWLHPSGRGKALDISAEKVRFYQAMNDDFHIPEALDILQTLASRILGDGKDNVQEAKAFLNSAFNILGLGMEYR